MVLLGPDVQPQVLQLVITDDTEDQQVNIADGSAAQSAAPKAAEEDRERRSPTNKIAVADAAEDVRGRVGSSKTGRQLQEQLTAEEDLEGREAGRRSTADLNSMD